MECQQRRMKHAQAVSTAQFNGWLAASQLGLRQCIKLTAIGTTVTAVECVPIKVNFTTEITECGAQPRYKNFTISRTGWELTNYSPCYWTKGIANFNNRLYSYRNQTWTLIETTIVVPQRDLADAFRYTDVKFFDYHLQSNPAYVDSPTSPMDIIADLTAAINEQSAKGSSQITTISGNIIDASITKTHGIFYKIKLFCFIFVFIILSVFTIILLVSTKCFGISRLVLYLHNLYKTRNEPVVYVEYEMVTPRV